MKKILPLLTLIFFCNIARLSAQTEILYSNTNLGSRIYNPGFGASNTPSIIFDDVNIADSLVSKSDSVVISQVQVAIKRKPGSPAVTVNIYASSPDTGLDSLNSLPKLPPVLIGTLNLPASGPSNFFTIGDAITPLATFKTDTGRFISGYQTVYIGMSFSDSVQDNIGWYLSNGPDSNYDLIYKYDATNLATPVTSYNLSGTYNLPATFYMQVSGTFKFTHVLPVTLTDFKAAKQDASNLLSWQTQSENNSKYFIVQRSNDGKNFKAIGQVQAAGYSTHLLSYQFVDNSPATGTNYYRLQAIDKDNYAVYSTIKSLLNEFRISFKLFPNPASSNLTVSLSAAENAKAFLSVSDANGKQVYSNTVSVAKGDNSFAINLSNIPKGLYIVKLQSGNSVYTSKFTKN